MATEHDVPRWMGLTTETFATGIRARRDTTDRVSTPKAPNTDTGLDFGLSTFTLATPGYSGFSTTASDGPKWVDAKYADAKAAERK